MKVLIIAIVLLLILGLDLLPWLRGPAPYPPEWQWPYKPDFSLTKLWLPLFVASLIFIVAFYWLKKPKIIKTNYFLCALVILFTLFQLSLFFYSRSGLKVLFFKTASPGMNGYFTASLSIKNFNDFLNHYDQKVLSLPQHSRGHPPGMILFYHGLNKAFANLPQLKPLVNNYLPERPDIKALWQSLIWNERLTAVISNPIIMMLSLTALWPIYGLAKLLFNQRAAQVSALLYGLIPSVALFNPLPDVLFAVFGISAVYLFVKGFTTQELRYFFASGLGLSLGLFFSLSLLPSLLLLIILAWQNKRRFQAIFWAAFIWGLGLLPLLMQILFGYNSFKAALAIISGLAPRSYWLWLVFNLVDYWLFTGVAVSWFLFLSKKKHPLFWALIITILITNVLGVSRAEVGRIWLIFTPFVAILVANNLKKKRDLFLVLGLQVVQILVMSSVLVLYG